MHAATTPGPETAYDTAQYENEYGDEGQYEYEEVEIEEGDEGSGQARDVDARNLLLLRLQAVVEWIRSAPDPVLTAVALSLSFCFFVLVVGVTWTANSK